MTSQIQNDDRKLEKNHYSSNSIPSFLSAKQLGAAMLEEHAVRLNEISSSFNAPLGHLQRQYLLHAPQFERSELNNPYLLEEDGHMYGILRARMANFSLAHNIYSKEVQLPKSADQKLRNRDFGDSYYFREVSERQANLIENRLHYLQSHRTDANLRFGLFSSNSEWPFAYTSLSSCDRQYLHNTVCESLNEDISYEKIISFCRIYAAEGAPKNSISKLISLCADYLEKLGFQVFTTAVNPFLQFSGVSLAASNFIPFATCPVPYGYDNIGMYTTRRMNTKMHGPAWSTPNNYFYMGSKTKKIREKILKISNVVDVKEKHHKQLISERPGTLDSNFQLENTLSSIRKELEKVWGASTRYHKTSYNPRSDPVSKGQCGVSSAYLAKQLEDSGLEVLFCEGDVYFDNSPPIEQHCWLVLPNFLDESDSSIIREDVIVDITADQSGYKKAVVCEPVSELKKLGIQYVEKSRTPPNHIGVEHLRSRLTTLQKGLEGQQGEQIEQ